MIIDQADDSAMVSLSERATRSSTFMTMSEDGRANDAFAGLVWGLSEIGALVWRSGNSSKGRKGRWRQLVAAFGVDDAQFSDPHSPWQRGQAEIILNRQLRQRLPNCTVPSRRPLP
jgi:IS30 family transposase